MPPDPSTSSWQIGQIELFNLNRFTGQPVLVAFTAGIPARAGEALSDAQLSGLVTAALGRVAASLGLSPAAAGAPSQVIVTRWTQDPFARGSYSFVKARQAADMTAQRPASIRENPLD